MILYNLYIGKGVTFLPLFSVSLLYLYNISIVAKLKIEKKSNPFSDLKTFFAKPYCIVYNYNLFLLIIRTLGPSRRDTA